MTTPRDNGLGRTLKPANFGVQPFNSSRVYPESRPDDFGQVKGGDKDRSQLSDVTPNESMIAHTRADTDASKRALHHTLGTGRNQASPGSHSHDGITGLKIGPLEMDPANPGNTRPALTLAADAASIRTFLHNFFEFRDI